MMHPRAWFVGLSVVLTACATAASRPAASPTAVSPAASSADAGHDASGAIPAVGTWTIEWELGRRIASGDASSINARGTLRITSSGDSLLATLTTTSRDDGGALRGPATFGGRATSAGATFTQRSQASVSIDGSAERQTSTSTWLLTVRGDSILGTIERKVAIVQGTMLSPVRGARVR